MFPKEFLYLIYIGGVRLQYVGRALTDGAPLENIGALNRCFFLFPAVFILQVHAL